MVIKFELTPRKLNDTITSSSRVRILAEDQRPIVRNISNLGSQLHKPSVCLTFDDGPDPIYTPMILDILREQQVKASFFVVGDVALHFPKIVGRIVDAGHTIGNHTYSHAHPWLGSADHVRREVSKATQVIKQIAGYSPRWFRPPFGRLRKAMIDQAHQEGMTTVLWSHSIVDWGWWGTEAGINRRLKKIKAGDIVLMHDGRPGHNRPEIIARQLPGLLDSLKQKVVLATLDQIAH